MAAFRKLVAAKECRVVPPLALDHLPDMAAWTLIQFFAVDRLEADVLPGNFPKLADVSRGLAAIAQDEGPSAGAGQCHIEKTALLGVGIGFRPRDDEVEKLVILDSARNAVVVDFH